MTACLTRLSIRSGLLRGAALVVLAPFFWRVGWRRLIEVDRPRLHLLRAALFAFEASGFYFAVVSATDPTLREGLRDNAEDDVRQACAARLVALRLYPEPSAVEQT